MCDSIGYKLKIPKTGINSQRNSNRNSPTSSTPSNYNTTSTDDLVISLDNNDIQSTTNDSILNKLSKNLELESAKKQLELEEMRIQIAMLADEKAFKFELHKQDLLQKDLDMKKKESDLEFTQKLQNLLIESLNNGDFSKSSYINICLSNQREFSSVGSLNTPGLDNLTASNLLNALQNSNKNQPGLLNLNGGSEYVNDFNGPGGSSNGGDEDGNYNYNHMDNYSEENSYVEEDQNERGHDTGAINNGIGFEGSITYNGEVEHSEMTKMEMDQIKQPQLDAHQIAALNTLGLNRQLSVSKNPPYKLNTYLLGDRNIRHMICSSPKLEEYSNSAALKILFKGNCGNTEICLRKEMHTHYLIDTTDCRRHISLYFQSSKYGLKFYKTYQIKSQSELEKIIRAFKMKLV